MKPKGRSDQPPIFQSASNRKNQFREKRILICSKNKRTYYSFGTTPLAEVSQKPIREFNPFGKALKGIGDLIKQLAHDLGDDYDEVTPGVYVHKTAKVFPSAYLGAPCIIGPNTEVRQCAFIRGNALVGADCVVGNSTELKNVILFDHVQVPHYNYVGDSILGYYSHMGAGSITSNVKSDKTLVVVKDKDEEIETGLKKFGAMLGDHVEVGCNSVLKPREKP